jgi:hypothetical protein
LLQRSNNEIHETHEFEALGGIDQGRLLAVIPPRLSSKCPSVNQHGRDMDAVTAFCSQQGHSA